MARSYTLDTEAAKRSNTGGKRIDTAGAYPGQIRIAFYDKNDRGTESVQLMFESDGGQEIGPLPLYTHKGDGTPLPGFDAFNAILTCARVRELKSARGEVELYDFNEQKPVTKQKEVYPALSGKRIGLFLRQEEYQKQSGEIGERMVIAAPFDPDTRLMAVEILNKQTEANSYEKVLAWIEKNPVKAMKGARRQPDNMPPTYSANDFNDDDIPF